MKRTALLQHLRRHGCALNREGSPADVVKEGSHFDLPIALAMLKTWKDHEP